MIKVSNLSDYAGVIINLLLNEQGARLSASELASRTNMGQATVSKVLKLLHDARLVESERGVNGGYRVTLPASSITLADVIQAIEGLPGLTACTQSEKGCQYAASCDMSGNWQSINLAMLGFLGAINFEHMRRSLSVQDVKQAVTSHWFADGIVNVEG